MSVFGNHICGCYYTTSYYNRTYLPQVHLDSHTTITPLYFITKLSQTFHNPSGDQLPETRYTFPLYDGVAVSSFTCTVGEKVIKGHVEQKEQARKTFDAAVSRGETAGLLESLPTGVFGVTLGNVPADASIQVDITYGGELKHDAQIDGLRYNLPTSIAPRYGNYPGELLKLDSAIGKGMKITVDIDMQGSTVRKVQCPSDHSIALDIGTLSTTSEPTSDMSKASVSLTHNTTELGSDFVLQVLVDDISSPKAILEKHSIPGREALMATFVPRFNLKSIRPEIIFIADQSGSMQGSKNTALVAALKTFLKSLPTGVRFNICAFGSSHKFLWEKSVPYNQENYTHALQFVKSFSASYGGTELMPPIEAAFKSHLSDMPLELFVLTDGEIYAESQLFDFVNNQIHQKKVDARCFVLGVGHDVSHTLVEGLARAGNGISQFITDDEVMDFKVVRMLKAALYPHVNDYHLEIKYEETEDFEMVESLAPKQVVDVSSDRPKTTISLFDNSVDLSDTPDENTDRYAHLPNIAVPESIQAPHVLPPLLPFSRTTVYLLLQDKRKTPKSVLLHGTCPDGPLVLEIPVKRMDDPNYTINVLSAKKAIQELEEGRGWMTTAKEGSDLVMEKHSSRFDELVEREAVRLGLDYQVANKWCSFVAVEPNENGECVSEDQVQMDTDLQRAHGYRDHHVKKRCRRMSQSTAYRPLNASSPCSASSVGRGGGRGGGGVSLARMSPSIPPQLQTPSFARTADPIAYFAQSSGNNAYPTSPEVPLRAPSDTEDTTTIPIDNTLAAVRALVDLQCFDGHWKWNDGLRNFFASAITKMERSGGFQEEELWATVLVLAWLKTFATEYRDLWEMVAEKGNEWLLAEEDSQQAMSTAMGVLAHEK
ncbi:uncharacterized protein M437DRAFT_36355 [Aureobasidium melanogenum CBS 110374]|uniref:VIT-domain-containing protein n=1 Tax=Aureobasidium melanogenum (strain CBS 110374) TaxID=1043003 RepID=A0A074W3L0_AURM1|nr:uncharacterized protein M437DRAFT_36355 [Aureobasidium melanogenum CBS 110374]KEQ67710.1 hypothetical protein M437DRAFT_36355 [Aureobasidium melanogenum CBS 110374]